MPYAQIGDVQGLIPHVQINANTKPSEGTVRDWIADVERMLDRMLEHAGFQVPVVGPESVRVLKQMVAHNIAAMVLRAQPAPAIDPETFQRRWDSWIAGLRDPQSLFDLPTDAVRLDVSVKDSSEIVRTHSNLKELLEEEPRIGRDTVF